MDMANRPIGIFDSGVGGLTVYKELKEQLPHESFVYLGDTARVPYGSKSKETVLKYALQNSLFLLDYDVKLIVVACNTASAFSLEYLQSRLKVPVVGVIGAGARAAIQVTKNNKVGIIGTDGTIRSRVYERHLKDLCQKIVVVSKATGLFVSLIEENILQDEVIKPIFDYYLKDLIDRDIDTLILGCTHYPILKDKLNHYFNNQINLVDSASVTAGEVCKKLEEFHLVNQSPVACENRIFVTDAPDRVQNIARHFLKDPSVEIIKKEISTY